MRKAARRYLDVDSLSAMSKGTNLVLHRRRGTQKGKQLRFFLGDEVKQRSPGSFVSLDGQFFAIVLDIQARNDGVQRRRRIRSPIGHGYPTTFVFPAPYPIN